MISRAERFAQYAADIAEINQDAHEAVMEIVEFHGTRSATEREFRRVTERQAVLSTAALQRAGLQSGEVLAGRASLRPSPSHA